MVLEGQPSGSVGHRQQVPFSLPLLCNSLLVHIHIFAQTQIQTSSVYFDIRVFLEIILHFMSILSIIK